MSASAMKSVCLLSLLALAAAQKHPIRKSLADRINDGNLGWKAHNPEHNPLAKLTPQEILGMMGLKASRTKPQQTSSSPLTVGEIPDSFDARQKFQFCQKPVRNQMKCGSCWAFAAAETLADNLCNLGTPSPVLSPQDLISCDATDHGCHGGTLPNAWDYLDTSGVVSDYCVPYKSGDGSNQTCPLPGCSGVADPDRVAPRSKEYKCPVKHSMLDSDEEIQAAVMTVGAVEVGFTVMEDFMNYKSGVYKYSEGQALGGHAVKIVGWGRDINTFYWLVQNSWGSSWGENGFFKIVNWHTDMKSAIAIGGGFACVGGGPTPAPPTPPPIPEKCEDIVDYCKQYAGKCAEVTYVIDVCRKTCGCCDTVMKPSYCPKDVLDISEDDWQSAMIATTPGTAQLQKMDPLHLHPVVTI